MATEKQTVYIITGVIPYSGSDNRSVLAVYLDKDKAEKRYEDEIRECGYLDVQMDYYPVDG